MPTVSRFAWVTCHHCHSRSNVTELEASGGAELPSESIEVSALSGRVNIHRAFKGSTGEHFYTTDANEAVAAGFQIEALDDYGPGPR